jgi:hypothetical protein
MIACQGDKTERPAQLKQTTKKVTGKKTNASVKLLTGGQAAVLPEIKMLFSSLPPQYVWTKDLGHRAGGGMANNQWIL